MLFGLCRSLSIIDSLVTHPRPHPRALARPSTPKVLQAKERTPIPYPSAIFTFRLIVESIKEFGGVSLYPPLKNAIEGVYLMKGGTFRI